MGIRQWGGRHDKLPPHLQTSIEYEKPGWQIAIRLWLETVIVWLLICVIGIGIGSLAWMAIDNLLDIWR